MNKLDSGRKNTSVELEKVEKSPFDPFVKWFFPKLLPFVPQGLTANRISYMGLILAVFCGISFWMTGFGSVFYLLGSFFLLMTWVTDTMDGIVARARKQVSLEGEYLDHYGDPISTLFIVAGLSSSIGSHIFIGAIFMIIYLLLVVQFHVMAHLTKVSEIPFLGPTELRLLTASSGIVAIFAPNPFVIFRGTGYSFIDFLGLFVCSGALIMFALTFVMNIQRLRNAGKKRDDR